ncbi:hypothetical protein RCS94_09485 [Orbaceae bacterium ac157xtp]
MKKIIFLIIGILALYGCAHSDKVYEEPTDTQERAKVVFAGDGFEVSRGCNHSGDYVGFYIETTHNSIARFYIGVSSVQLPIDVNNFNIPIPSKLNIYSQVYIPSNETTYFRTICNYRDPDPTHLGKKNDSFSKIFSGVQFTPESNGEYIIIAENLMKDGFRTEGNDCKIGILKVTGTRSKPVFTPVQFKIENVFRSWDKDYYSL